MSRTKASSITSQTLEGIHYVKCPLAVSEVLVSQLIEDFKKWAELPVHLHVIDFGNMPQASVAFLKSFQDFSAQVRARGAELISINMSEPVRREVKKLGMDTTFNRIQNYPGDLYRKKIIPDMEKKRLLFKYLAQAAYVAIEVTLNSTVSCDENYSTKFESIPAGDIDLVTVISINTDFIQAEFRLCSSKKVLRKFAAAMLGNAVAIDEELVESMALELLNMVYGHAKSNLNDKEGFHMPPAIPRLIRKPEFHRIKRSGSPLLTVMPMVTPMGSFYIEVDFAKPDPK